MYSFSYFPFISPTHHNTFGHSRSSHPTATTTTKAATPNNTPPHRHRKVRKTLKRHCMTRLAFLICTLTLLAITLHAQLLKHAQTDTSTLNIQNQISQTDTDITLSLAAVKSSTPPHNRTHTQNRHTILLLLLLCGDTGAMVNPGPYKPKYPCVICTRAVKYRQRAIQCSSCGERSKYAGWYHVSCIGSFTQEYNGLVNNSIVWLCNGCSFLNFSSSYFSPIPQSNLFDTLGELNIDNPPAQHSHLRNPTTPRTPPHTHSTHQTPPNHNHQSHRHRPTTRQSTPINPLTIASPNHSLSTISHCSRPPLDFDSNSSLPTSLSSSLQDPLSPTTQSLPIPIPSHLSPSPSTTSSSPGPTPATFSLSTFHLSSPPTNPSLPRNKPHTLRLLNINFRSIRNKTASLHNLISTYSPDIIIGTETWLTPDILTTEIFPAPFNMTVQRRDRPTNSGKGGGVLIATRPELTVKPRPDLDTDCEITWIQLQLSNCKSILISAFYRPPSSDQAILEKLELSLSLIPPDKLIWIAGDFNLPDIDWTAVSPHDPPLDSDTDPAPIIPHTNRRHLHDTFMDIVDTYSLSQTVLQPTRTQTRTRPGDGDGGPLTTTAHTLDLFLTNNTLNITNTKVIPGLSDHDIVLVDADMKPTRQSQRRRPIFLYSKADTDKIRQDLTRYSNDFFTEDPYSRPLSSNWDNLKHAIHTSMNNHIPQKTPSSRYSLPWFNRELRRRHRKKQRLYRRAQTYNTPENWAAFRNHQKTLAKDTKVAERKHIALYLADNIRNNKKHFYKFFKSRRQDTTTITSLKDHNDTLHTHPEHKAQILNTHFHSVFTQENSDTPHMQHSPFPNIPNLDISTNGILKLLQTLDINKAPGPDNIPPYILKTFAPILAPILQVLFTQSLTTGTLPDDWLCANVTPIFKTGDRTDPSNYRPISLTSIPCKILEHIIHKHVMNHLDRHNILTDTQHGFRPKRSPESQLIVTYHDIARHLDRQDTKQVDAILLDFAKAFDKVPHRRLKLKLRYYGLTGQTLHWITAFLTNRTQRVLLDGACSDYAPVSSGVPQGTVLGPLLFLLFINDLPEALLTPDTHARLFADDSLIFRPIKTLDDCRLLQIDLDALERWENTWQMKFRPDKCKIMSFTRSRSPFTHNYTLHNHTLDRVHTHKYLGLHLTSDLRHNTHINNITNTANRSLGFLRRNLHNCNSDIKHLAYKSLVLPTLEYCAAVWDPHTDTNIDKLEQINTRAARFIANNYTITPGITTHIKQHLNMQPLKDRRQAHRLNIMYKITNNHIDIPKHEYLTPSNIRYTRNSHTQKYHTISTTRDYYKHSFFPQTILDWNELPQHIIDCPTIHSFTNKLHKHPTPNAQN